MTSHALTVDQSEAQPSYKPIAILEEENVHPGDGSYNFHFSTENGIYRTESGVPLPGYGKNAYGQPEGSYRQEGSWSYTDGYGNPVKVTFVADDNGYQPSSDILPTPVPTQYPTPEVDPAYVEPQPAYVEPQPAYVEPQPAYVEPQPAYVEPQPAYPSYKPIAILEEENVHPGDGSYNFHFSTENGIYRSESGVPLPGYGKNAYGQPEGSYRQEGSWSYTDGYGNPVKVTFVADDNGYQPSSDILPTPVPTQYPTPAVDSAYVEPQSAYVESQPAYVEAQPAYVEAQPAYVEAQPAYVEPQPAYVEPQPTYGKPQPAYQPAYVEPQPAYN
ncbi:Cuticle protein AM1274 [Amphibalanus amphitrite]|uniref:Cuticle protein AM1274 n=1 Tax=Amphibalanus amphitrite TaxID=1232801 RepID=A0A6A4WCU7_AMPAM|nr:Cuticle protein AM1274 [Amphibalanus amphitrite]